MITRLLRAGSEENTIATCLGAAERGYRVSLIHGRDFDPRYQEEIGDRVTLIPLEEMVHPIRPLADTRAVIALTRRLRQLRPDIVHTHQSKAGIIGRFAAHRAGVPHVIHGVHIAPFVNVGPLKRLLYVTAERLAARHTDAFICVSKGMMRACLDAGIGRPDQYSVVYSGMPLDAFRHGTPPSDWRDLVGISEDDPKPPVLLMLAALEPRKRHVPLIEAFARVLDRHPETRLLLAGEGPYRPTVETAIRAAGLEDRVRLLGFRNDPGALVALSDLCLLTSEREGLPRVVVQYVAGGRPVVATHVPGLEEIVTDGVSGLICGAEDFDGLSSVIASLLDDPHRLSQLGDGATATDVSAWDAEALVNGTLAVYDRLFAAEAGPARDQGAHRPSAHRSG